MPRLARSCLPAAGVYDVTARGTGGSPIFRDDLDRLDFLSLFDTHSRRNGWTCHAYCLMTTHYHLVLETTQAMLSDGMHRLNGTYSLRFNRRHHRRGHLFESRYSAWAIRDERHLEATCRYVLDNPVEAGVCDSAGSWPWSAGPNSARRREPDDYPSSG